MHHSNIAEVPRETAWCVNWNINVCLFALFCLRTSFISVLKSNTASLTAQHGRWARAFCHCCYKPLSILHSFHVDGEGFQGNGSCFLEWICKEGMRYRKPNEKWCIRSQKPQLSLQILIPELVYWVSPTSHWKDPWNLCELAAKPP